MKTDYLIVKSKDYNKGGTFQTFEFGAFDNLNEAVRVAKMIQKAYNYLCEIIIYKREFFVGGSCRMMVEREGFFFGSVNEKK